MVTEKAPVAQIEQPLYHKLSLLTIGLVALVVALYYARPVLVPLIFALLLAMLLDGGVQWLVRRRVPHTLAIALMVLMSMGCIAGVGYFIGTQAIHFTETLPEIEKKLDRSLKDGERWIQGEFGMKRSEVKNAVEKAKDDGVEKGKAMVGTTLITMGSVFGFFFLLPVFTFMILLYKKLLMTFITKLFHEKNHQTLREVMSQIRGVVQSYLRGLVFETLIVAVLNWIGLMAIGVRYALLFAVLGAVLNLIPYIGMMIATLLPMLIAFATQDLQAALLVLLLYSSVQFVDNNLIVPKVVASRVQLNALVSVIVVLIFGTLWGIPGMFLAIPLTAMLKVIFDRVPSLIPFGYVLGEGNESGQELQILPDTRTVQAPEK